MRAPANNCPTDTGMNWASTISTRLGGISCARVPDATITPDASSWSYLYLTITGSESTPITITVAATTPVAAASRVPTNTTAMATPPRNGPRITPIVVSRRSASPDFSKIAPMNTKNGIASSVKLAALSANQRLNSPFSCCGSMSPCAHPIRKNAVAVPANVNATGYPIMMMNMNRPSMISARTSGSITCPSSRRSRRRRDRPSRRTHRPRSRRRRTSVRLRVPGCPTHVGTRGHAGTRCS